MVVVGIDEVGRGSWAGPLTVSAVAISTPIPGLRDSKKLTILKRNLLESEIKRLALAIGIGWASSTEIDKLGLTKALNLATKRAIDQIDIQIDQIIIDGNVNFLPEDKRVKTVIKADAIIPSVSAASIIAKVSRDKWMKDVAASLYPGYGFEKNVGYGTAFHQLALQKYGICKIHRKSFQPIKNIDRGL